jgi:hypothetical protein
MQAVHSQAMESLLTAERMALAVMQLSDNGGVVLQVDTFTAERYSPIMYARPAAQLLARWGSHLLFPHWRPSCAQNNSRAGTRVKPTFSQC